MRQYTFSAREEWIRDYIDGLVAKTLHIVWPENWSDYLPGMNDWELIAIKLEERLNNSLQFFQSVRKQELGERKGSKANRSLRDEKWLSC